MKWKTYIIVLLLCALFVTFPAGCSNRTDPVGPPGNGNTNPGNDKEPPPDAARLVETRCSICHTLDRVYRRRAKDNWPAIVNDMTKRRPNLLTDQEHKLVLEYLQENYSN